MKTTLLFLVLALTACTGKKKEYKEPPVGIRVTREPNGKIVSVPDSSRRDSL
ncbi:hypothetical protein [Spirosoma litoris]